MILENQELKLNNLISLRKKITQQEMPVEMQKLSKFITEKGAQKSGPMITATFAMEQNNFGQFLDIEILVPLDKEIEATGEYTFKKQFLLTNALKATHTGNPALLQNTYNLINSYIIANKLQPITASYNVTVKDVIDPSKIDELVIDIYVGLNPCIL
jgi:effector-binding domain-containing protein